MRAEEYFNDNDRNYRLDRAIELKDLQSIYYLMEDFADAEKIEHLDEFYVSWLKSKIVPTKDFVTHITKMVQKSLDIYGKFVLDSERDSIIQKAVEIVLQYRNKYQDDKKGKYCNSYLYTVSHSATIKVLRPYKNKSL